MIDLLLKIEKSLPKILRMAKENNLIKSMFIDYHPPIVERVWMPYGDLRIYFHKIHPCKEPTDALFHPHPWKSALRIIKGSYEMGIGHSETNEIPKIDCKLFLPPTSIYEMTEENGWHYVNPIDNKPVYSLMVTGDRNNREMPVEPSKKFRELTTEEMLDIMITIEKFYI